MTLFTVVGLAGNGPAISPAHSGLLSVRLAVVCTCAPRVCLVPRGQNGVSDPWELKVQMVVICYVGVGNQA